MLARSLASIGFLALPFYILHAREVLTGVPGVEIHDLHAREVPCGVVSMGAEPLLVAPADEQGGDTDLPDPLAHGDLEGAFLDAGRDRDNQVIIITGTGDEYSGPAVQPSGQGGHHNPRQPLTAEGWDKTWYWEGKHLLMNLLNIEVPMIAAINGPAVRHAEIPLLCDIVIASEQATIQDSAHFNGGLVPGDGVHIVFPLLMGMNRGRYFLLTGQVLNSKEAKELGLVTEVLEIGRAHV